MSIKKTYLILLLICASFGYAQEGIPVYQDYFADNMYLVHPSAAGAAPYSKLRVSARQQWFDQDEAPNTQTINFSTRIGYQSAIGAIAFADKNGYHSQTGAYLTYAHHIMFSRSDADLNQLSFGLSAGLIQSKLDETSFDPNDFDPIIAGIIQSSSYFNVDFGASYYFLNYAAYFTVKNLLFQNRNLFTEELESNNQRSYNFGLNMFFPTQSGWAWEPSLLFQWKERTGEQSLDVNFKAYRDMNFGRIFGGLAYRNSFDGAEYIDGTAISDQKLSYLSPLVGVNWGKFMFSYMYTQQFGNVRFQSGGFHGITLGYNFWSGKVTRWSQDMQYNGMLRPRGY